jgi:hypothetical protein
MLNNYLKFNAGSKRNNAATSFRLSKQKPVPRHQRSTGGLEFTTMTSNIVSPFYAASTTATTTFTVFSDLYGKEIKRKRATWSNVCAVLIDPPEHPNKKSCPLIKLATFGDIQSASGSLRWNENMLQIYGIEGDYDAEQMSIHDAAAKLSAAGVEAFLYTTPRHTPAAPRWRVLAPLSRAYAPADRKRFVEALDAALGGILARESFTPSQAYYFGRVTGAVYETAQSHGQPIDLTGTAGVASAPQATIGKGSTALFPGMPIPTHLRGLPLDATTTALVEGKPKSFAIVLRKSLNGDGCAQVAYAHDHQATLDEPRWRAGLSVARYCEDGAEAIHTMSRAHPGYTLEGTVAKANLIPGPWTCKAFATNWSSECKDCKYKEKISSPIQLGIDADAVDTKTMADAIAAVRDAEKRARAGDVGAPLETEAVAALRLIKKINPAEFQRLRADLKKANHGVSMSAIDEAVRDETKAEDRSIADLMVRLARERCVLFHDPDSEPHATFIRGEHRECWNLNTNGFREWLSHELYKEHGIAPAETAMTTALSTLAGQAKFDGEERPVAVRVAQHGHDYYIDLCDDQWQAIRVTGTGWQLIQAPPVMFVRTASMRPLPVPVKGGSIDALWEYANIESDDRLLVLAWLVETFRPDTPYPVLELVAEQGAAKSFTQSILRELTDPNKANLRAKPKSIDDLFVTAKISHMTSLENLSYLAADFQDALCSLATGAGYGGRTLYTNAEETVFEVKRPIMMNGISVVATAQDLMDRALLINCPVIAVRQTETDLNAKFAKVKPQLFGALLTLFADALSKLPTVVINPAELPRMADFAHIGEAVFRAMGRPDGEFLSAYHAKRRHGVLQTIDSSPVASALRAWLDDNPSGYSGSMKGLDALLARHRPVAEPWPKSAKALGDALRRITPAMRMLGFDIRPAGRHRDGYHLEIKAIYIPGH